MSTPPEGLRSNWITPRAQLERLYSLEDRRVSEGIAALAKPIKSLEGIDIVGILSGRVSSFLKEGKLTNWYTALDRLGMLPDKAPPLPSDISDILSSRCPIYGHERAPDGSWPTVGDTHLLYLIPAGSLNELEARVNAYGRAHLEEYSLGNPFHLNCFEGSARKKHGDTQAREPRWVLISKDVLPGSRSKSYTEQVQMIGELSVRALVAYEVPLLREVAAVAFFHKVATGESVLQHRPLTHTRVQEVITVQHLAIGDFVPNGLAVYPTSNLSHTGMMALRHLLMARS